MGLPGSGFTIASCSAYSTTNGVMIPDVSAGSNQVGASEKCTAQVPKHYPRPGWVEQAPEDLWTTVERAATQALKTAGIPGDDVAAIGITNQRETTTVWDRATSAPIHRAIVWQCRRTAAVCDRLRADGHEAMVRERTGLVLDAYFSGTKIAWILDQVPDARRRAARGQLAFGTVDTWLLWKLTRGRVHATDASNASRTLCLNLSSVDWDERMCALLRVPREVLPTIVDSSGPCGETSDLGWLPGGIPIAGIAGDQQAALFGQACFKPGEAKNTYGTGCFALANTGERPVTSSHGLLTTIAWRIGGRTTYALEGAVFVAGAAVQWLRDGLGVIASAAETDGLARSPPDPGGVDFGPAVIETTGLGAAYLAGLGVGWWRSLDAVAERHTVERTFTPTMAAGERTQRYDAWKRAVERSRGWATT